MMRRGLVRQINALHRQGLRHRFITPRVMRCHCRLKQARLMRVAVSAFFSICSIRPPPSRKWSVSPDRAGGIVVLDTDWSTLSIDTEGSEIERRLARFETEHMHQNGYAGRQLHRILKRQLLVDMVLEMRSDYTTNYALARQVMQLDNCEAMALAAGIVTAEELRRWQRSLAQAEAEDIFFCSLTMMLVAGRKP
jgi:hypothetical protein